MRRRRPASRRQTAHLVGPVIGVRVAHQEQHQRAGTANGRSSSTVSVDSSFAISSSRPSAVANTSASLTTMLRPARSTRPRPISRSPRPGRKKLIFDFEGQHVAPGRRPRPGRAPGGVVGEGGHHTSVSEAVLLQQRRRQRQRGLHDPGPTASSRTPSVRRNPAASNITATRWKRSSAVSGRPDAVMRRASWPAARSSGPRHLPMHRASDPVGAGCHCRTRPAGRRTRSSGPPSSRPAGRTRCAATIITSPARRSRKSRGRLIDLAIGLVLSSQFRAEHAVPRQAGELRQVGHQRDVAVRQRRDDEPALETGQPLRPRRATAAGGATPG